MYHNQKANNEKSQEDSCVQAWKATRLSFRKIERIRMMASWGQNRFVSMPEILKRS